MLILQLENIVLRDHGPFPHVLISYDYLVKNLLGVLTDHTSRKRFRSGVLLSERNGTTIDRHRWHDRLLGAGNVHARLRCSKP